MLNAFLEYSSRFSVSSEIILLISIYKTNLCVVISKYMLGIDISTQNLSLKRCRKFSGDRIGELEHSSAFFLQFDDMANFLFEERSFIFTFLLREILATDMVFMDTLFLLAM